MSAHKGKKRYAQCILSYIEDATEFWSKGSLYKVRVHRDGTYEIKTNYGGWGRVGPDRILEDFSEHFTLVWC